MKIITTTPEELQELIGKSVREALSELAFLTPVSSSKPMTMEQAALYLNISKSTLYKFTGPRTIPCTKVGRRLTFVCSELDSWLLEKRKQTHPQNQHQSFPLVRKEGKRCKR